MGKLPVRPFPVNPSFLPIPSYFRRQINAQVLCSWYGAAMYNLSRDGYRLLCADTIHCAGIKLSTLWYWTIWSSVGRTFSTSTSKI